MTGKADGWKDNWKHNRDRLVVRRFSREIKARIRTEETTVPLHVGRPVAQGIPGGKASK